MNTTQHGLHSLITALIASRPLARRQRLPPGPYPGDLISTPQRYFSHLRECGVDEPDPDFNPVFERGDVQELRQQNLETPIGRLPVELIIDIAEHLPLTDLWAFQLTCWDIAQSLVDTVHKANTDSSDWKLQHERFLWRCRRARFVVLALEEIAGHGEKLLCSWCTDLHPRKYFSSRQKMKNAHERKCRGADAELYLCPHKSMTWSQLVQRQQMRPDSDHQWWDHDVVCMESNCSRYKMPLVASHVDGGIRLNMEFELRIGDLHPAVLRGPPRHNLTNMPINSAAIRNGLYILNEYICPHVRTSDAHCYKVFQRMALERNDPTHALVQNGNYWPVSYMCTSCPMQKCRTRFVIDTTAYRTSDSAAIVFRVRRKIKKLETVMDPSWLMMTERRQPPPMPDMTRMHRGCLRCVIL